jgi:hypothetical protein
VRSLPSLTPAPARPRTRYRVARAARRLLGLTERGLESEAAEEADVFEGRAEGQSPLAEGEGDDEDAGDAECHRGGVEPVRAFEGCLKYSLLFSHSDSSCTFFKFVYEQALIIGSRILLVQHHTLLQSN